MSSQFQAIVEAAADLIRESVQIPSDVAVVAYQRGEVESEIERAMATLGAAVVVLPFETVHAVEGSIPPFYDEAELIVHILENPTLNATGVDGQALRDAVVLALAGDDLDGRLAAHLSEHRIIRADAEDLTIREITWKTAVQMQA
jgi:hypothetical protein